MRRGKKPTRKQKIRLGQAGLAPENWLVVKQKANGELIILNKYHDNRCARLCPLLQFVRKGCKIQSQSITGELVKQAERKYPNFDPFT